MTLDDLKARDPVAWFALTRTLSLEGGWVDNPADPGGATDKGVSLRFALAEVAAHPDERALFDIDHSGQVDRRDIAGLTDDAAAEIYFQCVWSRYGYGRLQPQLVAWKAFDICVNTGPTRASMILQEALGTVGHGVPIDGDLGPQTLEAVKAAANQPLISAMRVRQGAFYARLVAARPAFQRFAAGWAKRAAA